MTTMVTAAAATAFDREIRFGPHSFPFFVRSGSGAWPELLERLAAMGADRFVLITETSFPSALAEAAQERLASVAPTTLLSFEAGERAKTIATLDSLAETALRSRMTRRSVIVGLGGGLAGNVAGLLAALVFRGIRLVHIPTTLLGMSDSVLSLKQAVNSRVGKNHLGTFYAPVMVWNDLDYLQHLPQREIRSALCEMAKNVIGILPERGTDIVPLLDPSANYSDAAIVEFIRFCVDAKTSVMEDDPYEKEAALVLEYGHTCGHAIELLSGGEVPHGFAIGQGMLVAARVSRLLGYLSAEEEAFHYELLTRVGAPLHAPAGIRAEDILRTVELDNKRGYVEPHAGLCDMILLEHLGRPLRNGGSYITQVPEDLLREAIDVVIPGEDAGVGEVGSEAAGEDAA